MYNTLSTISTNSYVWWILSIRKHNYNSSYATQGGMMLHMSEYLEKWILD